ncbi:FAD-dependent pyridine nucleotide-disulfide oxidoreductase, partial [mine drainage metagenome]
MVDAEHTICAAYGGLETFGAGRCLNPSGLFYGILRRSGRGGLGLRARLALSLCIRRQPWNLVDATDTSHPDYYHRVVDCQWACPAHTDVPEYIRLIAQGLFTEAYLLNR